jgi:hypothetical protein
MLFLFLVDRPVSMRGQDKLAIYSNYKCTFHYRPVVCLSYVLYYTENEGPVRIGEYKCLVPISGFPEMKLGSLLISKTEF